MLARHSAVLRSSSALNLYRHPSHSTVHPNLQIACYSRQPPAPASKSVSSSNKPTSLNPRWLSDLQGRIGKCITFGLNKEQQEEAGRICAVLARDWRELLAGSEGYLTDPDRRGLWRHEVVWGEMDVMGHLNNVSYNRFAESARINWAMNFATKIDPANRPAWMELWTPTGMGLILRSIRTDYKFPMSFPDHVTVLHKLQAEPDESTDSFFLDAIILSELHRRPAARCVEDIVCYDYQAAKKVPLRPFMAARMRETFQLQEEAKKKWSAQIQDLISRVRSLEMGSWDRSDAKEDMGSAVIP